MNADAYAGYGMPADVWSSFDRPRRVLADPGVAMMVAAGVPPLAAALIYASDGMASLQWVGTVEAARGTGWGAHHPAGDQSGL